MNIKLVFKDTNFKIDVMEETPCQYLYSVAQKVFRKKSNLEKLQFQYIHTSKYKQIRRK